MSLLRMAPFILLVLLQSTHGQAIEWTYTSETVPAEFVDRVNEYAAVHRIVVTSLGPPRMWSDPEQLLRQQRCFANAMREGRPGAREGGIFTAAASEFFRSRIQVIVQVSEFDVAMAFEEPDEDDTPAVANVNEAFPWNAGAVVWPSMLSGLPELPPELEYRFLGRHLVLVDVLANLVVDVLRDALPESESEIITLSRGLDDDISSLIARRD